MATKGSAWPWVAGIGGGLLLGGAAWWLRNNKNQPVPPEYLPDQIGGDVSKPGAAKQRQAIGGPKTVSLVQDAFGPGTIKIRVKAPKFYVMYDHDAWKKHKLVDIYDNGQELSWNQGYNFMTGGQQSRSGWPFKNFSQLQEMFSVRGVVVSTPTEFGAHSLKVAHLQKSLASTIPGQQLGIPGLDSSKWWSQADGQSVIYGARGGVPSGKYMISPISSGGSISSTFKMMTGMWQWTKKGPQMYTTNQALKKVMGHKDKCYDSETRVKLTVNMVPSKGAQFISVFPNKETTVTLRPRYNLSIHNRKLVDTNALEAYWLACRGGNVVLEYIGGLIAGYIKDY